MKKQKAVWQLIKDSLDKADPVTLLYVLESSGSSPGRQGFLMAVTAGGKMEGSIGGGMMEHKLVELARERMQAGSVAPLMKKQIHDKRAAKNRSGMICSGEQTVLLYPVRPEEGSVVSQIVQCVSHHRQGTLQISPQGILFSAEKRKQDFSFQYTHEREWVYAEGLGIEPHLYIIGGGHCSLALSKLMSSLDFYIHLYDDREALPTFDGNDYVHEKRVLTDFSELAGLIPSGQNHYVVVMTVGYRTDDLAVRALLHKEFRYFGLLGSKAKIDQLFAVYRSEGFAEEILQKVVAPIGLPIKSETPEEIAVSIAAQIIQVKNATVEKQAAPRSSKQSLNE